MNALTTAENAALVSWTRSDHSRDAFMFAVREAIGITERQHQMSEDAHAAILEGELEAIRNIAYRASGDGMRDALEAIHQRASRVLAGTDR
jgi:hypothetical protein